MHGDVELAQEADRLEVLVAAVPVGLPLALFAGKVQVQHGGDGVHAQAVEVELLEPVDRVRDQEAQHLVALEVENQRAPVRVAGLDRIVVLVQGRAVEIGQSVPVAREMRRYPVEQHTDALAVEMEISSLFTVARYRGVDLSALAVVSDELASFKWRPGFKMKEFKRGRQAACEVVKNVCQKM